MVALTHAVCCALRLARYNAQIDAHDSARKAAGFLTGVPAPAGAGLALMPMILWLATDQQFDIFSRTYLVAPWTILIALLMISDLPTYSWTSLRVRRGVRLPALLLIGLVGAALITAPWATLGVLGVIYAAAIPLALRSYARFRRRRADRADGA